MKILFISYKFYPDVGGIEVNSEILAKAFQEAGHAIHLITSTKDSGDKNFPFPVIRNPDVATLLGEHKWADVVFENNPSLNLSWPALFFNKVSVVALRTWIARTDGKKSWQDRLKFLWLRRAKRVIAISNAVRVASYPAATVIGNPYRSELFTILPNVARDKDFVFLGRLVSDKGVDLAIRALHQLILSQTEKTRFKTPVSLTIIGDGPDKEKLQSLVTDLQLADNVLFAGTLQGNNLVLSLNRHRILLVPSTWKEPFGNVALEGMACGCVPIVSDGGGLPDAAGNAGLVCKRGDINSLLACMSELYYDRAKEKQLRAAAATHLTTHKPEFVAGEYLKVIEEAAKKK